MNKEQFDKIVSECMDKIYRAYVQFKNEDEISLKDIHQNSEGSFVNNDDSCFNSNYLSLCIIDSLDKTNDKVCTEHVVMADTGSINDYSFYSKKHDYGYHIEGDKIIKDRI